MHVDDREQLHIMKNRLVIVNQLLVLPINRSNNYNMHPIVINNSTNQLTLVVVLVLIIDYAYIGAVLELVLGRMGSRIHLRGSSADDQDSRSAAASVASSIGGGNGGNGGGGNEMSGIQSDGSTGSGPPSPLPSPFPSPSLQPINGSSSVRLNPRPRAESDL
jgi:hypothetical protein